MNEKKRDTILAAVYGAKEITELCDEINFNLSRLSEFAEDERIIKILEELPEKTEKICRNCITIAAICGTVADGKSGLKNVAKTADKILNRKSDD